MSATNHTTNYSLSQFIGTDKPAWLTDYNNDMSAIDTQMKNNADAAAAAQSDVTSLNTQINDPVTGLAASLTALDTQINTPGTGLAADVAANALAISGVANTVGNTPLVTTAQTCTGAINELAGRTVKELISSAATGTNTDKLNSLFSTFSALSEERKDKTFIKIGNRIFNVMLTSGIFTSVSVGNTYLSIVQASLDNSTSTFKQIDFTIADGTLTLNDYSSSSDSNVITLYERF